jgi:hypothetical protein
VLDASGKQGRYVRIQLLDSDYLSLTEVQVMGIDPLHFSEVDYSSDHKLQSFKMVNPTSHQDPNKTLNIDV